MMLRFAVLTAALMSSTAILAAPLEADLAGFSSSEGLSAQQTGGDLTVEWQGADDETLRLVLGDENGSPVIRQLAISADGGDWTTVAENAAFEFSIVEGYRRISKQQMSPLTALGVELTQDVVDQYKWDVFWDAPLDTRTEDLDAGNPPPVGGVAEQPGLPRQPDEILRASLEMSAGNAIVTGDEGSIRIELPGATLGTFSGSLVVTVFKGTNLIQAELEASTDGESVAYKYDAGIRGLAIGEGTSLVWKDIANLRQDMTLTDAHPDNDKLSLLRAANRIVAADVGDAAIAAFPPPHVWYWAREVEVNLGNNYYRKDADNTVAIGVGQAEQEVEQYLANWSLYSAPPGTVQHMRAYFYPTLGDADAAIEEALAFTSNDIYPEVDGHKVLAAHYHINPGRQWIAEGLDFRIDDFDVLKTAGIDIISLAERPRDETQLEELDAAFKGAMLHSDENFLILPNMENSNLLGGHWDLWFSKPTLYIDLEEPRTADQPLVTEDPTYGRIYQVGSKEDIMEMVEAENMLVYMPHPRTKGSSGYPDAVKDDPTFQSDHYRGAGWRWGMGSDLSEIRMSEKRVLPLLDDMNNWAAEAGYAPKFLQAITETYWKAPGDDIYGSGPVQYIALDDIPTDGDYTPIVDAMMAGDYFMSTGEVRLNSYGLEGEGADAVYKANIAWTFPLDFVEVVWGDGTDTHVETVPAIELGAFGEEDFEVPVDLSQAKWVRFAAWDIAGNGAFTNPVALDGR